jgi:CDGSH-type Zn-finger protein/uncharacterized Fe-S cluster protein YjdI
MKMAGDSTIESIAEPEIITQNREQLAYLLTEAAEIEHGLMCCYLYAAYSLKRDGSGGLSDEEVRAVARWRSAITSVAVEEMLHLSLVSNLLTAIGFAPQFARPNFPVAPGYHPSGIVVELAPFELATLDHFIFLERPEGVDIPDGAGFDPPIRCERATRHDRLMPSSEDYETVGHLYRGVRAGFASLASQLGERALFVGDARAQVGPEIAPLPGLTTVTDLTSAVRAIDTIVEQGEGTHSDSTRSHYRRFLTVRDEYRALKAARPGFEPALPVARNPVMRKPPDPRRKVHVDEPTPARVMDLGNAIYNHTLRVLARAFGRADDPPAARRVLVDTTIELMALLSPVAETLCRMPASSAHPGVHAGLSFAMARSNAGPDSITIWPLLAERTRELAASCAVAAKEVDPSLGITARGLNVLAARIEEASPVATTAMATAPLLQERAVATSPASPADDMRPATVAADSPPIEEARGKRLLLRFESKRCIHSRHCVLGAPDVFRANVQGAWLNPDGIPVEELVAIAHACPSGAITYDRLDGAAGEGAPAVNVIRLRENGPLAIHANIDLDGRGHLFRATLCRCGASKNKPFCDGSHVAREFVASGEPKSQASEPLAQRDGQLTITPTSNGPLGVRGNVEICTGTGRTVTRVQQARLCRCGGSANKPFCDGTHARIGFRSE